MYVEKPKIMPPATDGQKRCVTSLQSRYAAHEASAGDSSSSRFSDATGPNSAVTGHATSDGPGKPVTHAMFTPVGAHTTVEWNGLMPCVIAYGHQPRTHVYRRVSLPPWPT